MAAAAVAGNAKFTPIQVLEVFRPHESMYGVLFDAADRQVSFDSIVGLFPAIIVLFCKI